MGRVLAFTVGQRKPRTADPPKDPPAANIVILPVIRIERAVEPATGTDGAVTPGGRGHPSCRIGS